MKDRVILIIAAAALMIGGTAACSSEGLSAKQNPATLAPGTAKLTIDGKDLPTTRVVHCAPPEEYMTTITTGDDASGATVMVSTPADLPLNWSGSVTSTDLPVTTTVASEEVTPPSH